jgi:hypothetical protein
MEQKEITIADLNLLKDIVDLASTRGAFRAAEMKDIGEVYNKLVVFLDAVLEQAKAQEESPATQTQGE